MGDFCKIVGYIGDEILPRYVGIITNQYLGFVFVGVFFTDSRDPWDENQHEANHH